jgi:hypothetical protein
MASLRFNKKIYSRAAIDRAAEAYSDALKVTHRLRGSYHEVDLRAAAARGGPVGEGLAKEFANYVLYATLLERRA